MLYLSICQQCVHSLEEARLQHIGLVQDEDNLLIPTARATQHGSKVIIKVSCSVLAVNLIEERALKNIAPCNYMYVLLV